MEDYLPNVRRLIRNLRAKILDKKFLVMREVREADKLKNDLEIIFGRYNKLENEDFLIVDTVFKNYDTNDKKEILIEDLLNKVGGKLMTMVDRALESENFEELHPVPRLSDSKHLPPFIAVHKQASNTENAMRMTHDGNFSPNITQPLT